MLSGLIDEGGGLGFWRDRLGDFGQMQVHRFGFAGRQFTGSEPRPLPASGRSLRRVEAERWLSFGPLIAVCCQAYISELAYGRW
jgi:hypothetical protein